MNNIEFSEKAKAVAEKYKTLYIMGCFGAVMNATNKKRYTNNYAYNKKPKVKESILNASSDTFGFDCVGLIKGIIWGWNGNTKAIYGGATYPTKKMIEEGYCPDFGTEEMLNYCSYVTSDFSNIEKGEVLYMKGHVGIYIGDGLAVESTPSWQNKVQITAVGNIGKKVGYNTRKWLKHGKLKYIEYKSEPVTDYFEPYKSYKLLYDKYLRKEHNLGNNIVKYNNLDSVTKSKCNNVNGKAQLKKGTITKPNKIYEEANGRVWASYGNCWWVCQNVDGTKQAIKIN